MSEEKKVYSFEEVAKHNGKQDCWLLISGKVYDVTRFLDDHPGGDEILLTAIGKDATDDFEDVGHSDSAREMMKDFLVGSVDVSTLPVKHKRTAPPPPQATSQASQSSSGFVVKLLQFILPLMILGIAFVFKKMKKEE